MLGNVNYVAVNTYKETYGNEMCTACIPLATTNGTMGQTSNTCGMSICKRVIVLLHSNCLENFTPQVLSS